MRNFISTNATWRFLCKRHRQQARIGFCSKGMVLLMRAHLFDSPGCMSIQNQQHFSGKMTCLEHCALRPCGVSFVSARSILSIRNHIFLKAVILGVTFPNSKSIYNIYIYIYVHTFFWKTRAQPRLVYKLVDTVIILIGSMYSMVYLPTYTIKFN